jgi:hypothetical protein
VKEQDRNKAWGFTLFADDLRVELGGKISVMGLYQADMLFPNNVPFPVNIPKLFMMIMYYEIIGAIKDDVTFKVTFGSDNKTLVEVPVLRKDFILPTMGNEITPEEITAEDRERIFHSRMPVGLSPFTIPEPGRLRVRAHYSDGSVLKLGSIAARHMPVEEFNRMLGIAPPPPSPP